MNLKLRFIIVFCSAMLTSIGCSMPKQQEHPTQLCSIEWYNVVENKLATSDSQGHGPDVGSTEWRSVIEFKLGIRGDINIPPLSSEQWCEYINKKYIAI